MKNHPASVAIGRCTSTSGTMAPGGAGDSHQIHKHDREQRERVPHLVADAGVELHQSVGREACA